MAFATCMQSEDADAEDALVLYDKCNADSTENDKWTAFAECTLGCLDESTDEGDGEEEEEGGRGSLLTVSVISLILYFL